MRSLALSGVTRASVGAQAEAIFKLGLMITAPFLLWGFGAETLRIATDASLSSVRVQRFAAGAIGWAAVHLWLRRRMQFFETIEHEHTHLLFALLFFKRPKSIRADESTGGAVEVYGHNFMIALAPYFFPTVSAALVLIGWFVHPRYQNHLVILLGASFAYHLISTWTETGPHQPDLRREGLLFSAVAIALLSVILYGAVLAYAVTGKRGFQRYWSAGWSQSRTAVVWLVS